jgi:TetR/AcrR family transcriptional repressor of nem operon
LKYFETAIRDAHGEGSIIAPDARAKSRFIFALLQGALSQARILDDLAIIREAQAGVFELLGVPAEPEKSDPSTFVPGAVLEASGIAGHAPAAV